MPKLAVFATNLGWCGLVGSDGTVVRLVIGHTSADEVRAALATGGGPTFDSGELDEADWFPSLRSRLQQYTTGVPVDFGDCRVDFGQPTPFGRRVLNGVRKVGYGTTITYGDLAAKVRAPGAARAVGNVMAANRVPIIVPCHRVVAAGGKLGGYSAPQGLDLKQRLLDLEAASD